MSFEEHSIYSKYHLRQCLRIMRGDKPQTFTQFAIDGVVNPAPLIEWHKKHKARKAA